MTKKNIYICVTPFFPTPESWRGPFVLDQVKAIQRNSDYEVIVFKPTTLHTKTKEYEIDGIKVHLFPTVQMPSFLFNGFFNGFNGRMFVKAVKNLGIDLERVRFVHTHTGPYAVYGLALKKIFPCIKVLVQHHDLDPFTIRNGKLSRWKPNALYRAKNSLRLLNEVDLNICISEPVKDVLLSFPKPRTAEVYESAIRMYDNMEGMSKVHPKDVYVLNNGVDVSLFNENYFDAKHEFPQIPHKSSINYTSNLFRIGCIANFQELKDHKTLVQAFKILVNKGYNNMRLSLLGSGDTKKDIERYINENNLGDKVEWSSEVRHEQLPEYYHSLDLFVLPSYFEGFGCVYTEAYACGVPYICCYNQGAAECVAPKDRDKWLVEAKNPRQLANRIERYYYARDKQILCKEYDIDILIKDFLKYIRTRL